MQKQLCTTLQTLHMWFFCGHFRHKSIFSGQASDLIADNEDTNLTLSL